MTSVAADLAAQLARDPEGVCRRYLSNGRRDGSYWRVGDVGNTRGGSLYVRLRGAASGRGAAGRWTDAATGERGDLLDLVRLACGLPDTRAAMAEARAYLGATSAWPPALTRTPVRTRSPDAARRLWAASQPVAGTPGARYLRDRGVLLSVSNAASLRFHPACRYREHAEAPLHRLPALIAAVTNLDGDVRGIHRTWLTPDGREKADLTAPRRALGELLSHAVRFGAATTTLVAGEGLETMLALRTVLPRLPALAALSAAHLGAVTLPSRLQRLYLARDNDRAGRSAVARLTGRARDAGVDVRVLTPRLDDFNTDLRRFGPAEVLTHVLAQLAEDDAGTVG